MKVGIILLALLLLSPLPSFVATATINSKHTTLDSIIVFIVAVVVLSIIAYFMGKRRGRTELTRPSPTA